MKIIKRGRKLCDNTGYSPWSFLSTLLYIVGIWVQHTRTIWNILKRIIAFPGTHIVITHNKYQKSQGGGGGGGRETFLFPSFALIKCLTFVVMFG